MNASSEPQRNTGRIRTIKKQKLGGIESHGQNAGGRAEEGTLKAELAALEKNRHDSKSEISIEAKEKAEATLLQLEKNGQRGERGIREEGFGKNI